MIRSIRDELVELVPGVYLGKILFNTGSDRYSKIDISRCARLADGPQITDHYRPNFEKETATP